MGSRLESKSALVRKRIENHTFDNEEGDEYAASNFGGFSDYFRRKKIKLQNLDAEIRAQTAGDNPPIFKGIVAHVNGYTQPSLNDIHNIIITHGGGFLQYLDGKTMVTHIIASSLTPKKAVEFKRYRIVKPAWVVDSVKAGKLLPWDDYRVVDEGVGQKVLTFNNGQIVSQVNRKVGGYKDQTDASWYTSQLQMQAQQSSAGSTTGRPLSFQTGDLHDSDFEGLEGHDTQPDDEVPPPEGAYGETDVVEPTQPAEPVEQQETLSVEGPTPASPRKPTALTAEEHNSILLADPRIRKSTVVNPDFLEQYYRESRLHHLSTWKANLKSQLQALTAEKSSSQLARQKRPAGARRYIMHVDFDSFFAAVSLKKHPQYVDKPAVVAHGGGSGSEIASCNYPARKFGISNGMWMKRAQELCPDLKVLPYDFPAYEEASRKFYDAILATGGLVQSVSVDEALVDISTSCISVGGTDGVRRSEGSQYREQARADEIASELRAQVLSLTGCNVSVGIGANILQAKIALRKAKPAGQYQLKPEEVLDFIGKLEVQSLPGVAYSIGGKLEEIGIKYVKDIRELTKEKIVNTLGPKTGERLWEYSRGIDKTEVGEQVVRKSVSAEVNWGVRFENQEQVDDFIQSLCGELSKRLLKENVKGRQLTIKVMRRSPDAPLDPPKHLGHGKCDTHNKSLQLGVATNDHAVIAKEALATMRGFGFTPGELRGLGVQMTKLEPIKAHDRPQGSQQRLYFKQSEPSKAAPEAPEDPITDDVVTPKKQRVRDVAPPGPAAVLAQSSSPGRKLLNTLGTQFALPTQVDPKVLEELPEEIRARLTRQIKRRSPSPRSRSPTRAPSRMHSPAVEIPTESQLDLDVLNELPEDIRADFLQMYHRSPRKPKGQSVLPQSPRKNRTLPATMKKGPIRKRGGLFGRSNMRSNNNDNSTLTQANFIARPRPPSPDAGGGASTDTDGEHSASAGPIDPEVLAALPPELQQEILAQQHSERLRRTGGIGISDQARKMRLKQRGQQTAGQQDTIDKLFHLPPRRPKPTFTVRKLSGLDELRDAVSSWVHAFGDEQPYGEDVDALVVYLAAVVEDEGDMSKAQTVVKWLAWVVEEVVQGHEVNVKGAWAQALSKVKSGVLAAVKRRGLPAMGFD